MRVQPLALLFASITLTAVAYSQSPNATASCANPKAPSLEQLRALAQQYHPNALRPELSHHSVMVGFVLDSSCRVLQHAVGRRFAERTPVDSALASLFPSIQGEPFNTAGFADASAQRGAGAPWIVWVVLKG